MVAVDAEKSLVGTWKLLSREDVTSDGQQRTEPILGADPLAYLMYDAAGHFAVQFMRVIAPLAQALLSSCGSDTPITAAPSMDMTRISAGTQLPTIARSPRN